ncbi:hypothetical protein Tco_0161360, partial [Tanacetum coccineum]
RDKKDKDEDPSARPDRGEKRRKTDKDATPSKDPKSKEEPRYDSGMPHDQEFDRGTNDDQPIVKATKDDWFKKLNKPPTLDREWNKRLKIENLTQETFVGPAYYLLKGTCKSFIKLKYNFEEIYKAVNDRLDWNNLEGQAYLFDLRKSFPLIEDEQGRQVIPVNYFINNDLKYLKGGSSSRIIF